jgi:hypothetical protein
MLYGPHQSNTSLKYWRLLSDSIIERKSDRVTAALEFQVSTEVVDATGRPRAWWVAAQAPVHWDVDGLWSVTLRPELASDRDGRWTTFKQFVRALTTTLEYRARPPHSQAIFRFEYRYDTSTGSGGGFFKDIAPGIVGLTPSQHLLVFAWIVTFDVSPRRRAGAS